ncbi:hypothetical protein [Streptomyces phytohabitans]|uniref:hypothetical protein n=1 Tax=Streptomyces phytohabitans TaxID=1150371 RepID=UPI00345C471D
MVTDLAARAGLSLRQNASGDVGVVEDADPEARRRRLWGDDWLQFGVPALPGPDELDVLLAHTPDEIGERLLGATREVVRAAMATTRMSEWEDVDWSWTSEQMDEYDRLSALHDGLTPLLAEYARAVTESLPAVRAACDGRREPTGRAD